MFKSALSEATTNTMSRLAPTTWASVRLPDAWRMSAVRRGRRAWMTVSATIPPAPATQSPTAGKAAGSPSASKRNRPVTAARCSPRAPSTWYEPRSSATTRAASRPSAACGSWAAARASVQPRSSSVAASVISADPLELAGPLGVALGPAERPQPERDEEAAHDEERPDVADEGGHRCPVDQPLADPVEDVRRGRQVREHLHPARQDVDRVVHPADEEQARLEDERHLRPALHVQQRQDRRD